MRYPGRFLKNRTPPTVDRRGVPVGLSILLLVVLCLCVGEEEPSVHYFLIYKKVTDRNVERTGCPFRDFGRGKPKKSVHLWREA